jgi:hypothetical protein
MVGVDRARVLNNTFPEPNATTRIENCVDLVR